MKKIQILCPVYKEEEGIVEFHEQLVRVLEPTRQSYRISYLYAVDPSTDRTEQVLAELAASRPDVEILVMSRRFGHQAALIAGIDQSDADALVMLDSDGQHPPEVIAEMVKRWESGAEIVQGLREDGNETGYLKRTTSAMFYRVITAIGSIALQSGAADYRLLDRRVVDVLRHQFPERNVFLRGLVAWVGYNVSYVSFSPRERMQGRSKYRPSVLFNFALQGISSFSKTPLRLCTVTGMAIAALSLLAGGAQVVAYFLGHADVRGWASLMTLMSFLGGVQMFFMGIFGEYLGQIFDEVKRRPRYLVRQRYPERSQPPLDSP